MRAVSRDEWPWRRKPVWEMTAEELTAFYRAQAAEWARDPVGRGRYIVASVACTYCHTPVRADGSLVDGMLFAGGQKWTAAPFGDFVSYNLTADKATGLGAWTDEQTRASAVVPRLPWAWFANWSDEDRVAVLSYLRQVPAMAHKIPPPVTEAQMKYDAAAIEEGSAVDAGTAP